MRYARKGYEYLQFRLVLVVIICYNEAEVKQKLIFDWRFVDEILFLECKRAARLPSKMLY